MKHKAACEAEYEFILVLADVSDFTTEFEDAIFEAGCDDATVSLRSGRIFLRFTRTAPSYKDAILSAIRDVLIAKTGASVLRVDVCSLVTQSEIARSIGRSRQMVHQYITGLRGPGNFPAPACHLAQETPLWLWCEVSLWLWQNGLVKEDVARQAEDAWSINAVLDYWRQQKIDGSLVDAMAAMLQDPGAACPA